MRASGSYHALDILRKLIVENLDFLNKKVRVGRLGFEENGPEN